MTEPHIEKATQAVYAQHSKELAAFLLGEFPASQWRPDKYARAALDAAFAELAANPPEEMVEAFNRGWMDGFKNYAVGPGANEAHVETLRRRGALSAAFGALREKNDE